MGFLGLFNTADENAKKRTQEYADWEAYEERYDENEEIRYEKYLGDWEDYKADVKFQEDNNRFQEKGILEDFKIRNNIQNYEFNIANKAYSKSLEQSYNQKEFNQIAEENAMMEQDLKLRDDLLGVMFDEADSILNYVSKTSGLKLQKNNKVNDANFQGARVENKYTGDLGKFQLERRKARSESQISAQKAIVDGMKAVGTIRSRGTAGRSSVRAALGVMAESGALRANIANGLMYAEQGIDLGVAQLKDMLILDQTMVIAAKDAAENEYDLGSSTLDATRDIDKIKITASKTSIKDRDKIVRKMISQSRQQADLNADSAVMMLPERLPALTDPRQLYAEYDNPDTEDYIEMLVRPNIKEFPEYTPAEKLDFERDFHYSRGRQNAAASNLGDVFKVGGMIAGGIGAAGGIAAGLGGSAFGMSATQAAAWTSAGTGFSNIGSSFYPQR